MATLTLKEFYPKKMHSNSEAEVQSRSYLRIVSLLSALILSLAGAALAFYAAALTIKLTTTGITGPAGCSYNDWISCDAVLATNYARMFGAPVAWWGFLFYIWSAGALVYAFFKRKSASGYGAMVTVLIISSAAVLFSFFKMYQLITLGVLCPVCAGMYIANFGIFFFSMKAGNVTFGKLGNTFKNYFTGFSKKGRGESETPHPFRYLVFVVWVFAMGFLGMQYYENVYIKPNSVNIEKILTKHFSQEQVEINTEGAPMSGNKNAKVSIVEFSDFECPACKLLSDNMRSVMLDYGDEVSLYFMNYPLDRSINPNMRNDLHKNAGLAAIAGLAADKQGKFWEYQYKLFENQTILGGNVLVEFAVETGMDKEKFISDMNSEEVKNAVIQDIDTGKKAGVSGTPFLFVNGRRVEHWNSPEVIRAIIEQEIK